MLNNGQIGSYSFIIGVALAVVSGLLPSLGGLENAVPLVLLLLGLVVGFLNVNDKEAGNFLLAAVALMLTQNATGGVALIPIVGKYAVAVLQNLSVFVAPAALVVALKTILEMARDK